MIVVLFSLLIKSQVTHSVARTEPSLLWVRRISVIIAVRLVREDLSPPTIE